MEETHMTCINCPIGCYLTVGLENGEAKEVSGNQCNRGVSYARMESVNPTRMMTSTVRLRGAVLGVAPVKTARPIPKGRVVDCVCALKGVELEAPVTVGQVVAADICGTGVDIVVTRSIPRTD